MSNKHLYFSSYRWANSLEADRVTIVAKALPSGIDGSVDVITMVSINLFV